MTTSKLVPILSRIAVVCVLSTTLNCGGGGGPDGTGYDGGASAEGGAASGDLSSGKKDQASPAVDSAADARGAGDVGTVDAGGARDLGTVDAGSARDVGTVDATTTADAPVLADTPATIDVSATVDLTARADVAALADVAVPTDAPMLALGQVKIGPNGQVTVSYSNGSASTSAWIGLYASGAADGAYISYLYTPGTTSGTLTFTVPESTGQYDLRLFADGGYSKIATSPTFTVSYPYDLDPGFGAGGRLSFDFLGNSLVDAICSVIPLSSGKILLVGTAKTGNKNGSGWEQNEFALAQLNADGSFDSTFGQSGRAHAGTTTVSLAGCAAAAVQSDGKIVVAGWGESTTSGADYALARFTSVGALDATFGTAGFTTTNFKASATSVGEDDKIMSLAILTDGRILVRHTALGNLDTTFGKMRWKWTTGTTTLASRATSFAMQADGKLLLGGFVEYPGGNHDFAVIRLVKSAGW